MIDNLSTGIQQVGYRRACGEWIDQQFTITPSSHEQVTREMVAADAAWSRLNAVQHRENHSKVHCFSYGSLAKNEPPVIIVDING